MSSKLTGEEMDLLKRKLALADRQRAVDNLMWKCCVNCEFFAASRHENDGSTSTLYCGRWKAHPPVKVIVVGCEEYIEHIPF